MLPLRGSYSLNEKHRAGLLQKISADRRICDMAPKAPSGVRFAGTGDIKVAGEAGKLGELIAMLDKIPAEFPIVEPMQVKQ